MGGERDTVLAIDLGTSGPKVALVTVRGRIQALIERGMSEDEVVAAQPTAEFDAAWGQGFMNPENFTRFSYQSLTR